MHAINRSSGGMMEAVMVDFGGGLAHSFACSSLVCFLGWWMLACYGLGGLKTLLAASLWSQVWCPQGVLARGIQSGKRFSRRERA